MKVFEIDTIPRSYSRLILQPGELEIFLLEEEDINEFSIKVVDMSEEEIANLKEWEGF